MKIARNRKGIALGVVLMAIFVITLLILGAYFTNIQEYRLGNNSLLQTRAMSSADYGHAVVYQTWDKSWNTFKNGTTFVRAYTPGDGGIDTVRITKLNNLSFLVVSEGRAGGGMRSGARRRAGMLLRLNMPTINIRAAIMTSGNLTIGGSTALSGKDSVPAGWSCPPAGAPVAGAIVPKASNFSYGGSCKAMSCIAGTPLLDTTKVASDTNSYFNYGSLHWSDMVAMADKQVTGTQTNVGPSTSAGACRTADNKNWGDPNRAVPAGLCESYFPIVYSPGDLSINGNVGQGILLVNGNLSIQGNFTFDGPVIVRGTVKLTGTGNHINGAVLAANVIDSTATSSMTGNSAIQYSSCANAQALLRTALPTKAPQRGWAEMF
ncbi:MAG: hypothetical protein HOQ11_12430 [Gemmatimonadaceae bacterium]|nr:hypothetical protein [Gemmatimonadaceae bacterium]NUR20246.1 hypothetical protein [Gemmatimonadaceae bacterium]NUS98202.1 hypothetical protein [Gemmatimonadaceae bacterium]